jgi:hypothetical protein
MAPQGIQLTIHWPTFRNVAVLAFFVLVGALLFARAVNQSLGHDEQQHVASGQLLAGRGLLPYVDYPFLHMPYIAGFNALATAFTDYDLLAARGLVALCGFLSALLLFAASQRLLKQPALRSAAGLAVVLIFVTDPLFIAAHTRATNHALPSLSGLLACLIFLRGARLPHRWRWFMIAGVLTGLAAGLRLSYAVFIPAFSIAALLSPAPRPVKTRFWESAALGAGALLALIPASVLFLLAPLQAFYGNYVYFRLNTLYYQQLDHPTAMNLAGKLAFFVQIILQNPIYGLLLTAVFAFGAFRGIRFLKSRRRADFEAGFTTGLAVLSLATAFAPTPSQPQYFFTPLPFMLAGFIYLLRGMEKVRAQAALQAAPEERQAFQMPFAAARRPGGGFPGFLVVGSTFLLLIANGGLQDAVQDLGGLRDPSGWQVSHFHRFAENLRSLVPEGKVLTLAPAVPLEAGLDVYEIFAVGPFAWRTAPLVGDELRKDFGILSFTDLEGFLEADPPAAILAGFEAKQHGFKKRDAGGLEKPFLDYARASGYLPVPLPAPFVDVPVTLWIRK